MRAVNTSWVSDRDWSRAAVGKVLKSQRATWVVLVRVTAAEFLRDSVPGAKQSGRCLREGFSNFVDVCRQHFQRELDMMRESFRDIAVDDL